MIGETTRMELDHLDHLKFMMDQSKASRRKQSKPNRLRADEENQEPQSVSTPDRSDEADAEVRDAMDLSMKPALNRQKQEVITAEEKLPTAPVDLELVTFPCHSCGEVFASRTQQERHTAEYHANSESNKPMMSSVFPTAYHRLGTELAQGPALPIHPDLLSKFNDPPTTINSITGKSSNGRNSSSGVFQREAYCDICQREFCNKYFLKTHKANIHGIIDPNDPKHAQLLSKNAQNSASNPGTKSSSESKQQVGSVLTQLNQLKTTSINDMEDYCEICQKHFCNKYYLKKHKMDVHSIRPDGKVTSMNSATDNQGEKNLSAPTNVQVESCPVSMSHIPLMVPPINSSAMNSMLFNPFVPMSLVPNMMQHQFLMHNASSAFGMPIPTHAERVTSPSPPQSEHKDVRNLNPAAASGEAFCAICKKEFCNSYFLKVHLANKHGFDDLDHKDGGSSNGSAEQQNEPTDFRNSYDCKVEDRKRKMSPTVSMSGIMATPLSFDAMMAAKQADRIACEICNKEVCNKYFLKSHKLKMHSISSPPEESDKFASKLPTAGMEERTSPAQKPPVDIGSVDDTSPENLAKMGIDPEAYCNYCKKEFCSKYFLRTHKLNMHGIGAGKEAGNGKTPSKTLISPNSLSPPLHRPSMINNNLFNPAKPPQALVSGTDTMQWHWKEPASSQAAISSGSDKFTWRWKEPANATRVFCDLCNKELCNKYFLRTHKQNKHGVTESGQRATLSKVSADDKQSASSVIADLARATQQSMQNASSDFLSLTFDANHASPESYSSVGSASENKAATRDDVCQICGMVFENRQAVNEHVKLEHEDSACGDKVSAPTQSQKSKIYKCSRCNYKTKWLSNIYAHEAHMHSVSKPSHSRVYVCKLCQKNFNYEHTLIRHLEQVHGQKGEHITFKHIDGKLVTRKVKCNYCGERFLSRQLCHSHIRTTHNIRVDTINTRKNRARSNNRVFACDRCKFTCHLVKSLRAHQALKHDAALSKAKFMKTNGSRSSLINNEHQSSVVMMQEFTITGISGDKSFAESTVSLPVYAPVAGEVNVNLTLIPASPKQQLFTTRQDTNSSVDEL